MSTAVNAIEDVAIKRIGEAADVGGDFMSLDDRMLQAYAKSAVTLGEDRHNVVQSIELEPGRLSDPGHLFELQQRISDYSLQVSLTSTLTRKAVSAVETLLRA
ncbi:type III secretion system protein PrgJ [Oxalobacteraceae bacterium CAVE-383]|nr:type III secretion system protein PrgJ [Oxalobacteraceae bacterium CAVE-383]